MINLKINHLLYLIHSRYGAYGNISPNDDDIKKIYNKINILREEKKILLNNTYKNDR